MKIKYLLIIAFVVIVQGCQSLTPKQATETVSALVTRIKPLVDYIESQAQAHNLPSLASATINLSNQVVESSSGKLNVFFFGSNSKTKTTSDGIKLKLVPDTDKESIMVSKRDMEIANLVVGALEGVNEASGYKLESLDVTLSLVLKETSEGGISVEISDLGAEVKGSKSVQTGSSLTLSFAKK